MLTSLLQFVLVFVLGNAAASDSNWRSYENHAVNCVAFIQSLEEQDFDYPKLSACWNEMKCETPADFCKFAKRQGLSFSIGAPKIALDENGAGIKFPYISVQQDTRSGKSYFVVVVGIVNNQVTFFDGTSASMQQVPFDIYLQNWSGLVLYRTISNSKTQWLLSIPAIAFGLLISWLIASRWRNGFKWKGAIAAGCLLVCSDGRCFSGEELSNFEIEWKVTEATNQQSTSYVYAYDRGTVFATTSMEAAGGNPRSKSPALVVESLVVDDTMTSRTGYGQLPISPVFLQSLDDSQPIVFAKDYLLFMCGISAPTSTSSKKLLPHVLSEVPESSTGNEVCDTKFVELEGCKRLCQFESVSEKRIFDVNYAQFEDCASINLRAPKIVQVYSSETRELIRSIEVIYIGRCRNPKLEINLAEGGVVVNDVRNGAVRVIPAHPEKVRATCSQLISGSTLAPSKNFASMIFGGVLLCTFSSLYFMRFRSSLS